MHASKDLMWRGIWKILQNFLGSKQGPSSSTTATLCSSAPSAPPRCSSGFRPPSFRPWETPSPASTARAAPPAAAAPWCPLRCPLTLPPPLLLLRPGGQCALHAALHLLSPPAVGWLHDLVHRGRLLWVRELRVVRRQQGSCRWAGSGHSLPSVVGLVLRGWRRKETEGGRIFAFRVTPDPKWLLCLSAPLEPVFPPKTLCTTYFEYGLRNGYVVGVSLKWSIYTNNFIHRTQDVLLFFGLHQLLQGFGTPIFVV